MKRLVISNVQADSALDDIGFAYKDITNDGVDEYEKAEVIEFGVEKP